MTTPPISSSPQPLSQKLVELTLLFLKLGFTAFGGPAAHVGMLHHEVVQRRKWLDDQQFLDLLGATNLIPGPNSTEMCIHIGYLRAGWLGLILAGSCFILPAMLIVMLLAWVYVQYGSTPAAAWLLYGIKPVIIAVILKALWDLGRKAIKGPLTAFVGLAVFALYFFQVNELALLFAGGLVVMLVANLKRLRHLELKSLFLPLTALSLPALVAIPFSLPLLFFTFLKIGSVLYGSGYVLLAFMRADFVTRLGWLTDQQLIDAIAVGQVTPGPVFTTATFVGYILGGVPGALLATLGIFLPAFIFVAISNPLIPKMRRSPWVSPLLDGVIIASLGLMGAVTVELARAALVDPLTILLAIAALVLLLRFKLNATWLVLGGALVGLVRLLVG
jgi:chromate transporter